jgi:hypothetical protein
LKEMIRSWKTQTDFELFRKSVKPILTEATEEKPINRDVQETKMDMSLLAYEQLKKHSAKLHHVVITNVILFGALGEFPTSVIVAAWFLVELTFKSSTHPKLP